MAEHLHHVPLFSEEIEQTIAWWRDTLGGAVTFAGDFGAWKYRMCPAPDNVRLELFEVDTNRLDGDAARYFNE